MINVSHSILLIAIAAVMTFLLRAFPFLIFRGKQGMPVFVKNIANKLPPAIIAVLVVYCLKGDLFQISTSAAASAIALTTVILIHLWKRSTLLSIAVGTVIYMIGIRVLPVI